MVIRESLAQAPNNAWALHRLSEAIDAQSTEKKRRRLLGALRRRPTTGALTPSNPPSALVWPR